MQPATQPNVSIPVPVPPSELEPLTAPPPPVYNVPTTNARSHSLGDSSRGDTGRILITVVSAVLLVVISGAGGWFLGSNSTSDSTSDSSELGGSGSVDANLVGNWFSIEGEDSLKLTSLGTIFTWTEKWYTCTNGETVTSSWVNDGIEDCDDGTDEGVSNWTPGYDWIDIGEDFFARSSNNTQSNWYVHKDSGFLCIEIKDLMEVGGNGNNTNSVIGDLSYRLCSQFEKTGDIIWMFSDEHDGEIECQPLANMNRNNGPMGTDSGTVWEEEWNYVYSDFVDQKPQWCTTLDI